MVPFLLTLGVLVALIVGGTLVSLSLYTQRFSGVARSKCLRHVPATTNSEVGQSPYSLDRAYTDEINGEMSRYARNALIVLAFAILIVAMIVASILHGSI